MVALNLWLASQLAPLVKSIDIIDLKLEQVSAVVESRTADYNSIRVMQTTLDDLKVEVTSARLENTAEHNVIIDRLNRILER